MAQFRLSNFPEAVRSYDRALEVEPGDMSVLQLKRTAVVAKGDASEILKVCEDILTHRSAQQDRPDRQGRGLGEARTLGGGAVHLQSRPS